MHSNKLMFTPPLIAHRGGSAYAPENTLAAFKKAHESGIMWIECDVMLSKELEWIVIHDDTLNRTTNGFGCVRESSLAYIKTLDAGSWFHRDFAAERIPTLTEVMSFALQYKMSVNIEIKTQSGLECQAAEKILAFLAPYKNLIPGNILLSSFSLEVLFALRSFSSEINLSFLMHEWRVDWQEKIMPLHCLTININHTLLNLKRITTIKSAYPYLLAYTVNESSRAYDLLNWGVDAVFTDNPNAVLHYLNERA